MASTDFFISVLEALSRRDFDAVLSVGKRLADEERRKGHYNVAHRILEAVEVATSQVGFDHIGTFAAPSAQPQAPVPDLLFRDNLDSSTQPILAPIVQNQIEEFLREWNFESRLREKGLSPRHTILFYGPPGCGKTMLARNLATRLKMPLYILRFDALISSYLGETGGNIRKVFDFVAANRCTLLIDEIDAIAKLRDDRNELGELKRIVISLLQNLDLVKTRSLLIGATNHPHMLDPALWRRFELILELSLPNSMERSKIFSSRLDAELSTRLQNSFSAATEGLSGANLMQIGESVMRRVLMQENLQKEEAVFLSLLDFLRNSIASSQHTEAFSSNLIAVAQALRFISSRTYSYKELEKMTGIAHSTLHHKLTNEGIA